ncbi:hypothetical protein HF086_013535 [Spodoptera exigua]|uniref:Uncharacterized protein n=1 Tax=Spodoptera exigua TaxID=7107 RepID=A0A922MUF9_SPOEX|nr:hypothetical protein HF086_013535 [Spodoptera exigua]
MSPREQRIQRRKWKESSKKFYRKKVSQRIIENVAVTEESCDIENVNMNTDPLNIENQEIKPKISEISNEAEKTKNEDKKQLFDRLLSAEITQKFAKTANRKDKRVITKLIDKEKFKKFKVATDLRKVHLRERFKKNARNNINIQKLVEKFYEDDINSRITPVKKQYKKKHGIVKQVRYLLDSIKNLHKKFLAENTNIKISYTTFTRLRPFWVSLPTGDRDTCACLLHTNFNLLIAAVHKNNILHVKDSHNLIKEICCDKYRLDCLNRKCASCKNKTVPYKEFRNDKEIQYMIYNTPIGSTMENVKVIPENKRIKVLSDVTIRYANTDDPMLHDSTPSTSSLRSIRHSWANKCFINNYTKATDHEKEFLDFFKKCEDDDDDPLSD